MRLPLVVFCKKLPLYSALVLVLLASGCAAGVSGGNTPASQIIVRLKPTFTASARPDCPAAYLALAGAQRGYSTAVKNVLFSGAQVVVISRGGSIKPTDSAKNRHVTNPGSNPKTSVSPSDARAFVSYLEQQAAVDYAELDTNQQGLAATATAPYPAVGAKAGSPGPAVVSVPVAQTAFLQACGAGLAEPQPAR